MSTTDDNWTSRLHAAVGQFGQAYRSATRERV